MHEMPYFGSIHYNIDKQGLSEGHVPSDETGFVGGQTDTRIGDWSYALIGYG